MHTPFKRFHISYVSIDRWYSSMRFQKRPKAAQTPASSNVRYFSIDVMKFIETHNRYVFEGFSRVNETRNKASLELGCESLLEITRTTCVQLKTRDTFENFSSDKTRYQLIGQTESDLGLDDFRATSRLRESSDPSLLELPDDLAP